MNCSFFFFPVSFFFSSSTSPLSFYIFWSCCFAVSCCRCVINYCIGIQNTGDRHKIRLDVSNIKHETVSIGLLSLCERFVSYSKKISITPFYFLLFIHFWGFFFFCFIFSMQSQENKHSFLSIPLLWTHIFPCNSPPYLL